MKLVSAQPDAQQSRGRRSRIAERSESGLRRRFARNSRVPQNRKTEIRVIEHVNFARLDQQYRDIGNRERSLQNARKALEAIRRFEGKISDPGARRQIHERADELEHFLDSFLRSSV
jgi:hypothetical protein